jgi:hypothetical protein
MKFEVLALGIYGVPSSVAEDVALFDTVKYIPVKGLIEGARK